MQHPDDGILFSASKPPKDIKYVFKEDLKCTLLSKKGQFKKASYVRFYLYDFPEKAKLWRQ